MSDLATKFAIEAVLRALHKKPGDLMFYLEHADDPSVHPAHREALRQAVQVWNKIQKEMADN